MRRVAVLKKILFGRSMDILTILASVLYFKGAWKNEFCESDTKHYNFHLINGSSVKFPFMTSQKRQFIGVYNGFKVLRLCYKHGEDTRRFAMYIFLPDRKDGLSTLVDKMYSEEWVLRTPTSRNASECRYFQDSKVHNIY